MAGVPYNPVTGQGGPKKPKRKPSVNNKDARTMSGYQATPKGRTFESTRENNWFMDRNRDLLNFVGELLPSGRGTNPIGGGFGDYVVGSNPNDRSAGLIGIYRGTGTNTPDGRPRATYEDAQRGLSNAAGLIEKLRSTYSGGAQEPEKGLADYLREAMGLIGGGSGGGGVNYDPQRQTLRGNAAENDARLEAMYRQLRGSIDADAPKIAQAYQQAIDSTASTTATAQAQAQAATDAANARNNEVLANLGIQEAQGNIIEQGNDLNTQTARNIGDMAATGQAAGNRLVENKATSLTHNTNIGNAAGLEGNLQRAQNQARLQALLADIDMQEQQQNASRQDNSFAQQLGLAQELIGFDRYNQERQDQLQMAAAEMAAERQPSPYDPTQVLKFYNDLINQGYLAPGDDPRTQIDALNAARKLFAG